MDPRLLFDAYADQVVHVEEYPERRGHTLAPQSKMHHRLSAQLASVGIHSLYVHQALAYDAAMGGEDLVVVTGTGSGKTLCYNLAALQHILTEPDARAMYLFPTKALAQDQLGKLQALAPSDIRVATYDGDTPQSQRSTIRRSAQIILTNPDMLHIGILPGHENWIRFLKTIRVIVLDEMHTYRGVFGSHVGNVMRRLLRLCEWHGNRPQVIACSATIANPTELFRKLTGRSATLIDDDGAPKSKRTFVFWNPPMIDAASRASANLATSEIVATLATEGLQTIAFCRARVSTELVLRQTRQRLERTGGNPAWIESYRGGYTPKERRAIEQALFKGKLRALIATNAMELGVDVGDLDVVVMNGYPGTVSSFWQQSGRAGRGKKPGLAIFVAHDDPLEQFLLREPQTVLGATVEGVAVNPQNRTILAQQLKCAAHERPLAVNELANFGEEALSVAEALDEAGELKYQGGTFYYPAYTPPAAQVNIRSAGGDAVLLMVDGEQLGSMERWRALRNAHPGAIYLHRGQSYFVASLNLETNIATLRQEDTNYYTQPVNQSLIEQKLAITPAESLSGGSEFLCSLVGIQVTDSVLGYKQKSLDGERVLAIHDLDLPSETFESVAVRFDLPSRSPLDGHEMAMSDADLEGDAAYLAAIHGVEHALLAVAPLIAGCDRGDLGSSWYGVFPDTLHPVLFVYDRTPGGVGLSERLIADRIEWVGAAQRMLRGCPCADGCPACLLSAHCEANNELLDKAGALRLLGLLA